VNNGGWRGSGGRGARAACERARDGVRSGANISLSPRAFLPARQHHSSHLPLTRARTTTAAPSLAAASAATLPGCTSSSHPAARALLGHRQNASRAPRRRGVSAFRRRGRGGVMSASRAGGRGVRLSRAAVRRKRALSCSFSRLRRQRGGLMARGVGPWHSAGVLNPALLFSCVVRGGRILVRRRSFFTLGIKLGSYSATYDLARLAAALAHARGALAC